MVWYFYTYKNYAYHFPTNYHSLLVCPFFDKEKLEKHNRAEVQNRHKEGSVFSQEKLRTVLIGKMFCSFPSLFFLWLYFLVLAIQFFFSNLRIIFLTLEQNRTGVFLFPKPCAADQWNSTNVIYFSEVFRVNICFDWLFCRKPFFLMLHLSLKPWILILGAVTVFQDSAYNFKTKNLWTFPNPVSGFHCGFFFISFSLWKCANAPSLQSVRN